MSSKFPKPFPHAALMLQRYTGSTVQRFNGSTIQRLFGACFDPLHPLHREPDPDDEQGNPKQHCGEHYPRPDATGLFPILSLLIHAASPVIMFQLMTCLSSSRSLRVCTFYTACADRSNAKTRMRF